MIENQDDFDQRRFILAMVLSGIILVGWQLFFAPPPPEPNAGQNNTATQVDPNSTTGEQQPAVKLGDEPTATAESAEEIDVLTHTLHSDLFEVQVTNAGARVTSVEVRKPEQYQAEGNLLKAFPKDSVHFPFGISFTQNSIPLRRGLVWAFVADASKQEGEAFTQVTYRHTDPGGRFEIDKVFRVSPKHPYMLELDVVVRNKLQKGAIADRLALDITGYQDPDEEKSFLDMLPDSFEGLCKTEDDMERELFDSIKDPLSFDESPVKWAGVDTRYFLFAAVGLEPGQKCVVERVDEDYLRTRLVHNDFAVQPGKEAVVKYQLFAGPKDYDRLEEIGASLEESIDYGLLTFLCRPLRWALVLFYGWLGNWGLAIILLTLVIRILTWPINQKVYVNSEKMKEVQPMINEIKEKYADDQQRQAEETMKVFKEHGASPLGCLPMLLQFPILLALYFMILYSVELYQANFAFWYTDLSAPDPYFLLPILMGIVMFAQQKFMTPDAGNNPQMQQMQTIMKVMPIMFTAFMLFLPSGVVLYYLVSLLLGLVQQWLIKRAYRAKAAAA